ncbi:MAG: hypothetical protein ABGX41_02735, partial [Pseudohongiella sp.]
LGLVAIALFTNAASAGDDGSIEFLTAYVLLQNSRLDKRRQSLWCAKNIIIIQTKSRNPQGQHVRRE